MQSNLSGLLKSHQAPAAPSRPSATPQRPSPAAPSCCAQLRTAQLAAAGPAATCTQLRAEQLPAAARRLRAAAAVPGSPAAAGAAVSAPTAAAAALEPAKLCSAPVAVAARRLPFTASPASWLWLAAAAAAAASTSSAACSGMQLAGCSCCCASLRKFDLQQKGSALNLRASCAWQCLFCLGSSQLLRRHIRVQPSYRTQHLRRACCAGSPELDAAAAASCTSSAPVRASAAGRSLAHIALSRPCSHVVIAAASSSTLP